MAETNIANNESLAKADALQRQMQIARFQHDQNQRREAADLQTRIDQAHALVGMQKAEVEKVLSEARSVEITAQKIPELAAAIGKNIGEVKITSYGAEQNPFMSITQAVEAVLDIVRRP